MSEETARTKPAEREARAGTVIAGRYAVERLIARGGMASVYLASQVGLGRSVAVKVLSPPPDADEEASFEERFRLEASTLAGLDHANIVIVHDFGETKDGRFFIAMEYVNGPRLSDLLRTGPMDPEHAVSLMMQVCAAVRYAHRRGVVHRDLKPSNLLIRPRDGGEEQVKVVDFGLVKLAEHDQTLTRAGLILGSPHCMAPEQIRGLDVDHRADIYAIGVVLFRALTGNYPFHGENSTGTMIAHLNDAVPSFADRCEGRTFPPGLEEVVLRCLAKQADDRYDDVQELMEGLAHCVGIPMEPNRFASQTHSTITRQTNAIDGLEPVETVITNSTDTPRSFLLLALFIGAGLLLALTVSLIALFVLLSQNSASLTAGTPTAPPPAIVTEPIDVAPAPSEPSATPDTPAPDPVQQATTPPDIEPTEQPEPARVSAPQPAQNAGPVPRPAPVAAPQPRPEPAPTPEPQAEPVPDVVPEPAPAPEPDISPDTEAAPTGYLGMPEDF